jgi:hypothetical protein
MWERSVRSTGYKRYLRTTLFLLANAVYNIDYELYLRTKGS